MNENKNQFFKEKPINNVEVRLAHEGDAESLANLIQELLTFYGMPLRYQRSFMAHTIENTAFGNNSNLQIFLAIEKENPLGFLAFSQTFALATCQNSIFIQDLYIQRKTRNTGIGRILMNKLIRYGLEKGITQIDWTADKWNSKAISFYEHISSPQKSEKVFYRLNKDRINSFLKNTTEHTDL
tara:strand:- start:151 stop:699 length:549 start_codon:yes stop_codon:yes gene_type:complete